MFGATGIAPNSPKKDCAPPPAAVSVDQQILYRVIHKPSKYTQSIDPRMENGTQVNGDAQTNGNGTTSPSASRPRTPSLNTLSLTEYSTNPSPPSEISRNKIEGVVPAEFLLPNGYPDVGRSYFPNCVGYRSLLESIDSICDSFLPPVFTKSSKRPR